MPRTGKWTRPTPDSSQIRRRGAGRRWNGGGRKRVNTNQNPAHRYCLFVRFLHSILHTTTATPSIKHHDTDKTWRHGTTIFHMVPCFRRSCFLVLLIAQVCKLLDLVSFSCCFCHNADLCLWCTGWRGTCRILAEYCL